VNLQSNSSRWLLGVALVVLALVVLAVVVALVNRPGEATLLSEDTAEGTVQRYLLAIEEDDRQRAYGYLSSELQETCTYDTIRRSTDWFRPEEMLITLEGTEPLDGKVEVRVRITQFYISSPLRDAIPLSAKESSYTERFTLEQAEGVWRFTEPPWPMRWCPAGLEAIPIRPSPTRAFTPTPTAG
jgi:hypothetical protein